MVQSRRAKKRKLMTGILQEVKMMKLMTGILQEVKIMNLMPVKRMWKMMEAEK
jgi:hypothetical protein